MAERIMIFLTLLHKELLQLLKNPKTRIVLFLPPLTQLFILGYAATMDLKRIDFAVLDYSRGAAARELATAFSGNTIFRDCGRLDGPEAMANALDTRKIRMALVIPASFEKGVQHRTAPAVQVIVDGRNSSSAGIALGYAAGVMEIFNRDHRDNPPVQIDCRAWYNPNYNIRYFMVPALLALIALLDIMMLTALSIAREREDGTLDQLLLTPYSSAELLGAKAVASILVGLLQLTFGTLLARWWFEVPFRSSYLTLYLLFLAFLFASVGNGLLISVLSRNLQQAMLGTFLVAVPFAMLSGLATPIESMPLVLRKLSVINPIQYSVKALHGLFLEGASPHDLLPVFGALLLLGMISLGAAYLIFVHQRKI